MLARLGKFVYNKRIAIILVNWNGYEDTIRCIESIKACNDKNSNIIVVDNCSTNNSVQIIQQTFPDIDLIPHANNAGFGGGNNIGVRRANDLGAECIWLLNNDAMLLPDSIASARDFLENNPGADIIGTSVYEMDKESDIQSYGCGIVNFNIGKAYLISDREKIKDLDYITGTSMIMRMEVYDRMLGFDEDYFLYWEDTDFSYRAKDLGYKLGVAENVKILHKRSASSGVKTIFADKSFTESSIRFFRKHSHDRKYKRGILLRIVKRLSEGKLKNAIMLIQILVKD